MKSMPTLFRALAFAACAIASTGVAAQAMKVPTTKLYGKWATPDSRDGQRLNITLEPASGTGRLSLSFHEDRCTIRNAPMTMAMLGGRITLKSAPGYKTMCVEEMTLEMVPNPGRNGEIGYLGELRLTGSAARRAPILRGRLTEP